MDISTAPKYYLLKVKIMPRVRVPVITSIFLTGIFLSACSGTAETASVKDLLDKPQLVLAGHADLVTAVAVTPDGIQVVSGSRDLTIKVWDMASGRMLRSLKGHQQEILALVVTKD